MKISTLFYSKVYAQQTLDLPTSSFRTNTNSNTPIPTPSNDTPVIIMDPKQTTPNPVPTTTSTPVTIQPLDPGKMDALCTEQYGLLYSSIDNQGVCSCKDKDGSEKKCSDIPSDYISSNKHNCTTPKYSEWISNKCDCRNGYAKDGSTGKEKEPKECIVNKAGSVGIKCTAQDLINNTCSRNINKTLGIRSSDTTPNPTLLLQDVVLGATSFVGTIIMVALVYLGFKAVLQGADDSDALGDIKGKTKNLIIGFLLVIGSYTIIRLVQYIARGF